MITPRYLYANLAAGSSSRVSSSGNTVTINTGGIGYDSINIHSISFTTITIAPSPIVRLMGAEGLTTDFMSPVACVIDNLSRQSGSTFYSSIKSNPMFHNMKSRQNLTFIFEEADGTVIPIVDILDLNILLEFF